MIKFRLQFANKRKSCKLILYYDFYLINIFNYINIPDYISKFGLIYYYLAYINLIISNKVFIYILILKLRSEFIFCAIIV